MAEPPEHDPLFDQVDQWQLEENHVAAADRLAWMIGLVLAVMVFVVLAMLLFN